MKNIIQSVLRDSLEMKIAVSPPGWSGTIQKMLDDHPEIDNPYALAWSMSKKKKGDPWGAGGKLKHKPKPHYKPVEHTHKKTTSINQNRGLLLKNNKKFWMGSANVLDGNIEEVHTYKEAQNNDFHHSFLFSQNQYSK